MSDDFIYYKNTFHNVLNAYTEATKNNIITLQDKYSITPITSRNLSDFSKITGVSISGATALGDKMTDQDMTVSSCASRCMDNTGCVGALYTEGTNSNTCQLYSSIPLSNATSYSYNDKSTFISYNHYLQSGYRDVSDITGIVNGNVMNTLDNELRTLYSNLNTKMGVIGSSQTQWNAATTGLQTTKDKIATAENKKKLNQDVNSQLSNSRLNVIKTKTMYILFIALLLITLAIYVRDFNFSIFISIILFLMISVYGSIFLGAFLLLVIVLYLVYYAH
jgi:hypothetical protein